MIRIDEDYVVDVDDFNYTLKRVKVAASGKNKGKEYFQTVGYFHSLSEALERYGQEKVRDGLKSGTMTLSEALTYIRAADEEVSRTIREAIPNVRVIEEQDYER